MISNFAQCSAGQDCAGKERNTDLKTMIAYSSTHGSAAQCARWIADTMEGAEIFDLKKQKPDPFSCDCVILGSAVYGGQIQKEVSGFCKKYLGVLLQKPLGIYLTCLTREETELRRYLKNGFPAELVGHLSAFCAPGGALYFTKMNFLERNITRTLLNGFLKQQGMEPSTVGEKDYVNLSRERTEEFANRMAQCMEGNPS